MASATHRLLQRSELIELLQLPDPKIQWLIDTHQLRALRLCGEDRFDAREIDQLIETYKQIATRKDPNEI